MFNPKNNNIESLTWHPSRLGEAIELLARKSGLLSPFFARSQTYKVKLCTPKDEATLCTDPEDKVLLCPDDEALDEWIDSEISRFPFLEVESVESLYGDVGQMISGAAPAVIRVPGAKQPGGTPGKEMPGFLILLKGGLRGISVIAPDLSIRSISRESVRNALTHELEAPFIEDTEQLLKEAGVPPERIAKAKASLLRERLADKRLTGCWLLRFSPGAGFWKQFYHAGLLRIVGILLLVYISSQILMLMNWWIIGKSVFQGYFDPVWLVAWGLLLFSNLPVELLQNWTGHLLSIGIGGILKKRLLYGSIKLNPEEIRHHGAGEFFSMVMEAEVINGLMTEGGFSAVFAVIQLFMAMWVLSKGAGGMYHSMALLGWMFVAFLICWRYYHHHRNLTKNYIAMSNDLVERMVGHRTRLAQESPEHWHEDEDDYLHQYLNLSEMLDRTIVFLQAVIGRGWMVVGLFGIAYVFLTEPESKIKLAISLGGVMLAFQSLGVFVAGIMSIIGAKIAWEQAGFLFQAASRRETEQSSFGMSESDFGTASNEGERKSPLIICSDLLFRYHEHGKAVLRGCNLRIHNGDRLLLEGPSGCGKSTLSALISGLRTPESGLLLLHGVDQQTLGLNLWRKRIVSAPQFHENHVLTETFSFNLLMGRRFPPTSDDLKEAEIICRELGLGELLDRMPAGFQQMVGESGWQLSHGERSRLYIARALLQKSDLIILDESFAALDPENLRLALECVLKRAKTLLVIAHP